MATSVTIGDIYNTFCEAVLEPYESGTYPGLQLGIITQANFFSYFGVVLSDFVQQTGVSSLIFTQQLQLGVSQYTVPENISRCDQVFVGGVYLDHSTLDELDDSVYNWRQKVGVPDSWHDDGLPPKTIELYAKPSYTGTAYSIPDPTFVPPPPPPYGTYGTFDASSGNVTMVGAEALATNVFADLSAIVPIVPDSFCHYLGYGVLAEAFSVDGEAKDMQRAAYCRSRYEEGINLISAISGRLNE
jgi:hypothetical protein